MTSSASPAPAIESPAFTILCVDDEPNILSALRRLFRPQGYTVKVAGSGAEGLAVIDAEQVDLIISDMRMPGMDGAAFLAEACKRQPDAVRLLLTGYADMESTVAAINSGQITRYISKPWNDYELIATLGQVLTLRELTLENQRLADQVRLEAGAVSAEEIERKRLEAIEPGITQVIWGPDGSVLLDESLLDDAAH